MGHKTEHIRIQIMEPMNVQAKNISEQVPEKKILR